MNWTFFPRFWPKSRGACYIQVRVIAGILRYNAIRKLIYSSYSPTNLTQHSQDIQYFDLVFAGEYTVLIQ